MKAIVEQEIDAMKRHIPDWPQAQYATADQLHVLLFVATRLGLYDAADWMRNQGVR